MQGAIFQQFEASENLAPNNLWGRSHLWAVNHQRAQNNVKEIITYQKLRT